MEMRMAHLLARHNRREGCLILSSPKAVSCLLLLLILLVHSTRAQNADFNQDGPSLDYSYDPVSPIGPSRWSQISNADTFSPYVAYHTLALDGNECGSTYRPSPLHLRPTPNRPFAECIDRHEMLTRQIDPTFSCTPFDATFSITPHTLKMHLPHTTDDPVQSGAGCLPPHINLSGNFPDEFTFGWLEVHARSDHVIDGKRFDAEIQMVHFGQEDDDYMVATVSVLVDATARRDHAEFQWMLDRWQEVADGMQERCSREKEERDGDGKRRRRAAEAAERMARQKEERRERRRRSVQEHGTDFVANFTLSSEEEYLRVYFGGAGSQRLGEEERHRRAQYGDGSCRSDIRGHGCPGYGKRRKAFPHTLWPTIYYFGYRGSITAPPCADIVNWRVLDVPIQISKRQYQQLTRLIDSYHGESSCGEVDKDKPHQSKLDQHGENYQPLREQGEVDVFHCTPENFRWWMYLPEDQ